MNCSEKPVDKVRRLMLARYGAGLQPMLDETLDELESLSDFSYHFQKPDTPPEFLLQEPYASFLQDYDELMLVACTLGWRLERRIRQLEVLDLSRAFVLDQAAGLFLEALADEYEKNLARQWHKRFSRRFCPGYSGSDLHDNQAILKIVRPAGMELSRSFLLRPAKSMAGLVGMKEGL